MEHDLHNQIKEVLALGKEPIVAGDSIIQGNIIDTAGFGGLEYIIISADFNVTGTFDFLLEEDDVIGFGSATVVPTDEILGSTIGFVGADDDTVKRIGSIGKKRFQRLSIDIVGASMSGTSNGIISTAILSNVKFNPSPSPN